MQIHVTLLQWVVWSHCIRFLGDLLIFNFILAIAHNLSVSPF